MRKVLVRWEAQDGAVTVCADQMGEHQLLPSHLVLYNVIGVGDAAFPTISVDTLVIKKEEISFICEGTHQEPAQQEPTQQVEIETEAVDVVPTVEQEVNGEQSDNGTNGSDTSWGGASRKYVRRRRQDSSAK